MIVQMGFEISDNSDDYGNRDGIGVVLSLGERNG